MDAISGIVFLAWLGAGVYFAHRSRGKDWGYKFWVYFFFVKGAILYLIFYYAPYILIKTIRAFVLGMNEGRAQKKQSDRQSKNSE